MVTTTVEAERGLKGFHAGWKLKLFIFCKIMFHHDWEKDTMQGDICEPGHNVGHSLQAEVKHGALF